MKTKNMFLALAALSLLLSSCNFVPGEPVNKNSTKEESIPVFGANLKNNNVNLSLYEKSTFNNPVNKLSVDTIPPLQETTFSFLPNGETLDSDSTDYLIGANRSNDGVVQSLNFFKYTFFIRNNGLVTANYTTTIRFTENTKSSDGRSLVSTLRVMVFENDIEDNEHLCYVYAEQSKTTNYDLDGNLTNREPISTSPGSEDFYGFAEKFVNSDTVSISNRVNFAANEAIRYTVVFWLEGFDPESTSNAPQAASLKLGVTIDAKEQD